MRLAHLRYTRDPDAINHYETGFRPAWSRNHFKYQKYLGDLKFKDANPPYDYFSYI